MNDQITGETGSISSEVGLPLVTAAKNGDADAFSRLSEPYRRELSAHCYRMTGSLEDAEDLVQETFLRAWRRIETYEGRASFRAWLYKIATNASLDALARLPRRIISLEPNETGAPAESAGNEEIWLQPFPDAWLAPATSSPEARYEAYESISLAFMVALQILPPRQRSALILADVLDWPVAEVADALEISVSAATSLLRRARVTLKQRNETGRLDRSRLGFPDHQARQLLDRYARAWEQADLDGILDLLADDATFPMPPMPFVIQGKQAMGAFYMEYLFQGETNGRWKLVPLSANAQPGFAFYRLDETTRQYHSFVLQVVAIEQGKIVNATTFGFPALFKYFDLPEILAA